MVPAAGSTSATSRCSASSSSGSSLDYALAAASGVLLALSFPKFGHAAFAWLALAPLLVALARGTAPRRAFLLGVTTGAIYFAGTLYWITHVMATYGDMPMAVAVLINATLVAGLALYPAFFALIMQRAFAAFGIRALAAAPFVWVTMELGRDVLFVFGGFPWVLLGYSQVRVLPVAQLASVIGVYGVSALVASSSAAIAGLMVAPGSAVTRRGAAGAAGVILVATLWGASRVTSSTLTHSGEPIVVGVIQGNVDQGQKWNPARGASIFGDYLRLTRQAIANGARFVLWPESSIPFYFEEDRPGAAQVRQIARESGVSLLLGSDQIQHGTPNKYFNAAFMVRGDGTTAGVYRKIHLVPFGEYVPMKNLLFFIGPLVQAVSDFSPGTEATLLPVDGHLVSTSICYEVVYPGLVRRFVTGGSELLTTITNDAWFGDTSAPYQHFAQASMRAIEEGRYLVRSANTGVSGIVDPYGRVLRETGIYQQAVATGEVRFLRDQTVYARIGDAFAYACALASAVMVVLARRRVQYAHVDR